jgi:hypothetical protein
MKTLLLSVVSFSIALAQVVTAEEQDKDRANPPKTRAKVTQAPRHVTPVGPHINQKTVQPNQYPPKVQSTARIHTKTTIPNVDARRPPTMVQSAPNARNTNWQRKKWQNNKPPNTTLQNKNWQNKNNQNTTLQKKNWQNRTVNNNSWEEARRRHHRLHHHRDWWRSRFSRFALFGSGYYFWDGGYWYPAYGYDPAYNTYAYDEPIYGYNDLNPAQVIANVQTELQRRGYYRYAVDGQMGPMTRAAIANYQRDKGLSITSAIDEPTLTSLGLG